jgi:hypothetical protein
MVLSDTFPRWIGFFLVLGLRTQINRRTRRDPTVDPKRRGSLIPPLLVVTTASEPRLRHGRPNSQRIWGQMIAGIYARLFLNIVFYYIDFIE